MKVKTSKIFGNGFDITIKDIEEDFTDYQHTNTHASKYDKFIRNNKKLLFVPELCYS